MIPPLNKHFCIYDLSIKYKIFCFVLIFSSQYIYADGIDLLDEYKLLYTDLTNIKTWGYKSFFNNEYFQANKDINISQGAIQITDVPSHFAIFGEGFLKIRLENNIVGYTRSGEFSIDSNGNIRTQQEGYFLYDNICLGESFLPETLKITQDHSVFISIVDNGKIIEKKAGQLITYKIPNSYLQYYKSSFYIIKNNIEYQEEIIFDNTIINGALEMSNYLLLPVVLRMYYILSALNESVISNIEFKRELIKIIINELLNEITTTKEMDNRINYLGAIIPFIKYDY
jgi:flagellar basal body rod protein FlgF